MSSVAATSEDDFHRQVTHAARQAAAVAGTRSVDLVVAGCPVRLEFAGDRLAELFLPALARHVVESTHDRPTVITVWDTASTGVDMPPPARGTSFTPRGEINGFETPYLRTAFNWSEYSVSVLDTRTGEGSYWVRTPDDLPYWARSSPMRTILGWVLRQRGIHLIHGAAVGRDDRTVLLVGAGGSGKSTTALRAAVAGMDFIGDDYVAVSSDPPTVHHLYASAKLDPSVEVGQFDRSHLPGDEKAVFQVPLDLIPKSMPLTAIAAVRITDSPESAVELATRASVRAAALNTTLEQIPHPEGLEAAFDALLASVANGQLGVGSNPDHVLKTLESVLREPSQLRTSSESDHPLVSVVIPVHNGAKFIPKAIESVRRQNYPNFDVIVVDDGSTDDVRGALADLDVAVNVIEQPQRGPSAARNAGIAAAAGSLITFLDVDDVWPPSRTAELLQAVAGSGVDVAIGHAQMSRLEPDGSWQHYGTPEASFPWYIGAAMYRREIFDRIGGFDEEMRYAEDIDWFARLQADGAHLRRIPFTTLEVRRHGANMTEGRDAVELHVVRAVKKALDRKRVRANP